LVPVEEVLALWREAERLLDELPQPSPERIRVQLAVEELRGIYQRLTTRADGTHAKVAATEVTLESAQRAIREAQVRLDRADIDRMPEPG
jgi:Tfp pilus assembly pilus retraction ATPase PilT